MIARISDPAPQIERRRVNSVTMIKLAFIRLMLRRLAPPEQPEWS